MTGRRRLAPRSFYSRVFAVVVGAAVVVMAGFVLWPVWQPLAWAVLLAVLLQPAQMRLAAAFRGHGSIAAALLTLLTVVVMVGPVSGLAAAFGAEVAEMAQKLQKGSGLPVTPDRIPELREVPVAGEKLDAVRRYIGVSRADAREWMAERARSVFEALGRQSGKLALGALGTLVSFAIMLVVLFFGLRDGQGICRRAGELVPWPAVTRRHLAHHLDGVLRALVFGTLITSAIQGVLVGIAFAVLGLPGPVVFGALAGLCALVPMGGTALVWGPAVAYLAFDDRWTAAVGLALWGMLLVGTIDNLIRPLLVAGRAEVGTLTVFVGVIGGLASFGVIGIILGPLILCLLISLLSLLTEKPDAR